MPGVICISLEFKFGYVIFFIHVYPEFFFSCVTESNLIIRWWIKMGKNCLHIYVMKWCLWIAWIICTAVKIIVLHNFNCCWRFVTPWITGFTTAHYLYVQFLQYSQFTSLYWQVYCGVVWVFTYIWTTQCSFMPIIPLTLWCLATHIWVVPHS
jgi:hypothetical protein